MNILNELKESSPQGCGLLANKCIAKAFVLLCRSQVQTLSYPCVVLGGGAVALKGYSAVVGD